MFNKNKVTSFNLNYHNIPVIYAHNNIKCTSIIIDFSIGSLWETEKEKGIAHLVEHLMFKDTGKHTSEQLLKQLEINGADINACTSFDFTRFYFSVGNDSFEKTLSLFVEMLMFKDIPEHEFQKEKSTVIQELKMNLDDPNAQSYFTWAKDVFNIDDIIGFEKVLKNIQLKDVYRWISKHIIANNMIISVNSSLSKTKIKKILEKHFLNFRSIDENCYDYEKIIAAKNRAKNNLKHEYNKNIFKLKKSNQQNHIIVNYPITINNDKDLIKLEAFRKIISGGLTSVLFREIREKYGYCYTIKAYSDILEDKDFREITGYNLNIVTNCMPKYVQNCIEQIDKVMSNINFLIDEEDLIKVKNKYKNTERKILELAEINLANYKLFNNFNINIDKEFNDLTLSDIKVFINNINIYKKNISIYGPSYK